MSNGSLNNDGESLVLARTLGDGATDILEVDVVDYDDLPPWVPRADGLGPSLGRMDGLAFANDPANWASSSVGGTPGQENTFEDPTPPSVPQGLAVALLNDGMIGLGWHVSSDPESRVDHYTIYRNGRVAGTSSIPFYRDSLVGSDEPVEYSVRAVNPDGFESELSNAVSIQFSTTTFQEGIAGYRGAADSRIRQGSPDLQEGDSRRMGLDGNAPGESGLAASTLLRWSDLNIPAENRLLGATISLNVVNPGDAFEFRPMLTPWDELEVTWNQAADGRTWQASGASGSLDRGDVIGLFEPNVRGIVNATLDAAGLEVLQSWLDTPSSNYGVILADPGGSTDSVTMDSSQSPSTELRPKLTLLHTDAPRPMTRDINLDGSVNSHDLDALHAAIQDASGDLHFDVDGDGNVNQQDVDVLLAQLGTLRGDANLDGDVNFADFLLLSANFGRTEASWEQGDANGDRQVNFADFLLLSSNFGRTRQ